MEVIIMAKPIEKTPVLEGDSAKAFIEDMKRPNTPEENIIKERISNRRNVKFL